MKIIKLVNIFILILAIFQMKAQESVSSEMIHIEFKTLEKKSNNVIIASVIEVLSKGERIGVSYGDYDGISKFNVCSKKIIDNKITLKVYGMKCKPFQNAYKVDKDLKITINLEYGQTRYKTLDDRKLILSDLNILVSDIEEIVEELKGDTIYYKHCDGRIKKKNEIPNNELSEWKRIEN